MAPSKPAEHDADEKIPNGSIVNPTATPLPHQWSTLESMQETWEDIKDAVTETQTYISLSTKFKSLSKFANSAWKLSNKLAWVLGTTSLVLVVPLLYEIDKEMGPDASIATPPSAPAADSAAADSSATDASTQPSPVAPTAPQQS